jgi:hypothetical protein
MNTFAPYAPTFARYGLLIASTKLADGGWLPPEVSHLIAADPAMIELATGLALGAGTLLWFVYSKAKKAISEIVG